MCSAHVLALPLDADVRSHRVDQEIEHQKGESGRGRVVLHAEITAVALKIHTRERFGEEVCRVELRTNVPHADAEVPDVVSDLEVPGVEMSCSL